MEASNLPVGPLYANLTSFVAVKSSSLHPKRKVVEMSLKQSHFDHFFMFMHQLSFRERASTVQMHHQILINPQIVLERPYPHFSFNLPKHSHLRRFPRPSFSHKSFYPPYLIQTRPDGMGQVEYVPLSMLVKVTAGEDLKTITAGKSGEYIPFRFYDVEDAPELMAGVDKVTEASDEWDTVFSGSFFSNQKMLDELVIILFVSILLMYFILAAQFESFLQPLIVLFEIPVDVAFSLVLLWVCGHTLNLMSAIGLIVTCGIIINDSILKLDAINELRKGGMPLLEAIHEAGRRRLRPIVMTSLTTIFAMVPLLFSFDMGSELQKPLSIAMIGAMLIGTLVSLFIIPLIYWYIYRKSERKVKSEATPC